MKNVPFSVIKDANSTVNLFTNLTTFLAYDPLRKDVYFERTASTSVSERFEATVTPKQAIQRLKALGLLIAKSKDEEKIMLRHSPTGEQLSIAVNKNKVMIGSHFLAADDAPVSYLSDTRHLLNKLLGETVAI